MSLPIYSSGLMHPDIRPKILKNFLPGEWNRMTRLMFILGSFIEAFIWRLENKRDNAVIIEGERGEGKTNTMLFFLMLFNYYFHPELVFNQAKSVYLGRDVDLTVNFIRDDHQAFESIAIDESEICLSRYTAITIQNREAKILMDTFRDLKLGIFFICPDKEILDPKIVERCNWNVICDWNDIDKREVEVTVEYYGKFKDRTHFEWKKFQELRIPWVPDAIYSSLYERKHSTLYTKAGMRSFKDKRQAKMRKKELEEKAIRALKIQEVVDSKVTLVSKMIDLLKLGVKKSKIISILLEEGANNFQMLQAEHLYDLERAKELQSSSKQSGKNTSKKKK